jgi:ABC-type maltose transport system permease subunit
VAIRWWRIERQLSRGGRFYLYTIFTIAVVAYIVVPWVIQIFASFSEYNPAYYEPKDFERGKQLEKTPFITDVLSGQFYPEWWKEALKLLLLVLVGALWFVTYSSSSFKGPGRRSSSR